MTPLILFINAPTPAAARIVVGSGLRIAPLVPNLPTCVQASLIKFVQIRLSLVFPIHLSCGASSSAAAMKGMTASEMAATAKSKVAAALSLPAMGTLR